MRALDETNSAEIRTAAPPVNRWRSMLKRALRTTGRVRYPLVLAFFSVVLTLGFGVCAYMAIENKMPPHFWLDVWKRSDALNYLKLAEHGYSERRPGDLRMMIVFLPLYPLAIGLAHTLIRN